MPLSAFEDHFRKNTCLKSLGDLWGRAWHPGPVVRVPRALWAGRTLHRPHCVRSCEPALHAVGVLVAPPRGCLAPLWGASGVRRSSFPSCPPSGRVVRVRCPLAVGAGVQAWGLGTVPLACMPCGGLRAAAVVIGRPGGVAFDLCEGRLASGAVPPLASRPFGRAARARCPCVPAPAPQHALLQAGVACCGGGGRRPRGGGVLRRCERV